MRVCGVLVSIEILRRWFLRKPELALGLRERRAQPLQLECGESGVLRCLPRQDFMGLVGRRRWHVTQAIADAPTITTVTSAAATVATGFVASATALCLRWRRHLLKHGLCNLCSGGCDRATVGSAGGLHSARATRALRM